MTKKEQELQREIERLRMLVKQGEAVVNDFIPNIGRCALRDYERLNMFLVEAGKVESGPTTCRTACPYCDVWVDVRGWPPRILRTEAKAS